MKASFLLFLTLISFQLFSQQPPTCGTDLMHSRALQDSAIRQKHTLLEQSIYQQMNQQRGVAFRQAGGSYVLPVVVHIIHNNGSENISDAQVFDAIDHINDAFANVGYYDSLNGVNTNIQFCLAKQTPQGAATNGIVRVQSSLTDLDMADDVTMKNLSRWNPLCYANIWIVKEICSQSSGCGVAGYAYFPSSHGGSVDGLVVEARYFGTSPGNTGVAVHELGHYLGLYHTFQGGCTNSNCLSDGDKVCDTPPDQSTAAIACGGSANTCSTDAQSGLPSDLPDNHTNYMDYGFPACMNMYTQGQTDRMRWHIDNARSSLLNCISCNNPCTTNITAQFAASTTNATVGSTVTFSNGSTGAATYSWYLNGQVFSTAVSPNYTFNTQGTYIIRLIAVGSDVNCISYFNDTIHVICGAQSSFTQSSTAVNVGQSITFTNTSTGATSYQWHLDGVLQTTTTNFSYTFNQQGTFAVYLIASNGICSDTTSIVNFIHVGPPCNISFTYSQSNPNTYLVSQPDATAGKDAHLFSVIPGSSNGTSPDFLAAQWTWQGVPGEVKSLLQFDLSVIPTGSIINSASLSLYADIASIHGYSGTPMWGNTNASYLKRVTSTWDETSVNWINQPSSTSAGQVLLPQSISTTQDYTNIDITAFVQYWSQNPSQNYGMSLDMITNNYYNSLIFCSSDHPDSTKRPKLVVNYTPPANTCFPVYFTPDTTCRYSNYYWSFCQPANLGTPVAQSYTILGNLPTGGKLLKDHNGNYHAFYTEYNTASALTSTVYRLYFGNSVNNTPTVHAIYTPAITATYAHGVDIIYEGGNYYGFALYNNSIYRLDFGTAINDTPAVAPVTGFSPNAFNWGHKIELVRETNSWWILVVARNSNSLNVFYLGNSPTNNVQASYSNSCQGCWGFSYQNVNGNHYVHVTSFQTGMRLMSFGNSLANTPVNGAWGTYGSGLHGDVALYQNCDGSFDGVILKENQAAHAIIHLDSITATPTVVTNFSSGVARSGSCGRLMRTDAGLTLCFTMPYNGTMGKLTFPDCGIPFSTEQFPPPVYYPQSGSYYVRLAVDEGLPSQQVYCATITVDSLTVTPLDLGPDTVTCANAAIPLDAGAGYKTYLWDDGSDNQIRTTFFPGTYWVEATDSCNNTYSDTITISVDSATAIVLNDATICLTTGVILTAPTGFADYVWTPATGLSCATCSTTVATPSDTTAYTVTATTLNGCVNSASATINVNDCGTNLPLTALLSSVNVSCTGGNDGSVSVFVSGGTPPYSYLWSTGHTTTTVNNLSTGSYSLTVSDSTGTTIISNVFINAPAPLIIVTASFTQRVTCFGESSGAAKVFGSGGTPAYTYLWNNGHAGDSPTNLPAGAHTVTVTDANGCTASSVITILDGVVLDAGDIAGPDTVDSHVPATFTVNAGYNYTWQSSGSIIGGQATSIATIDWNNAEGFDTIQVIVSLLGCVDTLYKSVVLINLTSIDDIALSSIELFPNPNNGLVTVKSGFANAETALRLFDAVGKMLFEKTVSTAAMQNGVELDLSLVSEGIYFLHVKTGNAARVMKVVRY